LNDLSTLDTSPSPFPTLKLVSRDGVEVTFPALPLLAVSSSLAHLVTETTMDNSDSCAVVHLPVTWEAVKIVRKLVLLGFATSESVSNTATSKEVFEVLELLGIEENIIILKANSTKNLNTEKSIKISRARISSLNVQSAELKSKATKGGDSLVDMFDSVEEASFGDKEDFEINEKMRDSRNGDIARTEKTLVELFDYDEEGSYGGDEEDLDEIQTGRRKKNIARTDNAKTNQEKTKTTYNSVLERPKISVSSDPGPDLNGNRKVEIGENLGKSGNFETVFNETNGNSLLSVNEEDEIIPEASSKNNHEVPTEEEDPEMDDGLAEYERVRRRNIREKEKLFASLDFPAAKSELAQSACQNSSRKRRAAAQTCLVPLAQRPREAPRRSTRLTAAAAQGGRLEKESLGSSIIGGQNSKHRRAPAQRTRLSSTRSTAATAQGERLDESDDSSSDEPVDVSYARTQIRKYPCDECPAEFSHSSTLSRLKKSVHDEVKLSCDLCPAQFSNKSNLLRHKSSVHEGIKHPCDKCPAQFSYSTSLSRHKKAVHDGVKLLCDLCPAQFARKDLLSIHKKSVHEGIKYPCDLCPHKATHSGNLATHKKVVHKGVKR